MCRYFLNISSTLLQYHDNTDNRDKFGHYNRDKKCSYRYIPIVYIYICVYVCVYIYVCMYVCIYMCVYMKSSDVKASKCHLKLSSKMSIFLRLLYLCSVI